MRTRIWHWFIGATIVILQLAACIQINQQYNTTHTAPGATNETGAVPQAAAIRPSPTPVAPFPGIVYETAGDLWQVESYNESSHLNTIPAVSTATPRQLRDFGVAGEPLAHVALSPTGNWLAITHIEEDGQATVWVVDREQSERLFLGKGMNAVWSPDGRFLIYNTDGRPQLVLADQDFYQIHLDLPPGSQVVGWLPLHE